MLNTEDFIKRLEFIMEHYGLNASSFADKVSVQRSSISHLLSGRNKPSLDFVMKILGIFPELNLYWLLDGSGGYLKNSKEEFTTIKSEITPVPIVEIDNQNKQDLFSEEAIPDSKNEQLRTTDFLLSDKLSSKHLEKIVFFYTDGTFNVYKPSGIK